VGREREARGEHVSNTRTKGYLNAQRFIPGKHQSGLFSKSRAASGRAGGGSRLLQRCMQSGECKLASLVRPQILVA
jgi:hypothetical protein